MNLLQEKKMRRIKLLMELEPMAAEMVALNYVKDR